MASSLSHFSCCEGKDYKVEAEWCKEVGGRFPSTHFDLEKALLPLNYERFVTSVARRLTPNQISVNGEVFELCGNKDALHTSRGSRHTRLTRSRRRRVLFVPSKGRWSSSEVRSNLKWTDSTTTRILLVPFEERGDYSSWFGDEWLVISPVHDRHRTIGHARACILMLARYWKLPKIWIMDDSVPTGSIRSTSFNGDGERSSKNDELIPFRNVLRSVTSAMTSMKEEIADMDQATEAETDEDGMQQSVAIMGVTSTRSVGNVRRCDPQVNYRAPTALTLLNLEVIPDDITYDSRLPYKEDVIFAGRLIQARVKVAVYRELHFKDTFLPTGGCSEFRNPFH